MSNEECPVDMEYMRLRCADCGECWEWRAAFRDVAAKRWPVLAVRLNKPDGTRYTARWYARHVMLWLKTGKKPELGLRKAIVPTCDNPQCVNPDHLRVVSRKSVTRKTVAAGHMSTPARRQRVAQAKRLTSKLSDEAVREIRCSSDSPKVAAAKHGVTTAYVYMLRRGEWRKDYGSPFAGLLG